MSDVFLNLQLSIFIKMERLKSKMINSIQTASSDLNGPLKIGFVILAIVAIVAVAHANRNCVNNGWRGFRGGWNRVPNQSGFFVTECFR